MNTTCSNCNAVVTPTQNFCTSCGTKIVHAPKNISTKSCVDCNKEILANAKFCTWCGAKQSGAKQYRTTQSAPQSKIIQPNPTYTNASSKMNFGQGNITSQPRTGSSNNSQNQVACAFLYLVHVELEGALFVEQLQSVMVDGHPQNMVLIVDETSALYECRQYLNNFPRKLPTAICIVAPPDKIPHICYVDPTGKDHFLWTDNPYGMLQEPTESERFCGHALPDVAVCRIPSMDVNLIQRLLNVQNTLHPSWEEGIAFTAKCWEEASQEVLRQIGGSDIIPLHCSPEMICQGLFHNNVGRVYCNVHGSNMSPCWYGDDGMTQPKVLDTADIACTQSAIVMSEACYGAYIDEDEEPNEAISYRFLEQGAGAFIGSTIIAWGPVRPPISLADIIVAGTYEYLDQGLPLPVALLETKRDIQEDALRSGNPLAPNVHNTLMSFVAYGAPDACVKNPSPKTSTTKSTFGSSRSKSSPQKSSSSILGRVRGNLSGNTSNGVLGRVRKRLQRKLPASSWEALSSERISFASMPKSFRNVEEIQRKLEQKIGASTEVEVRSFKNRLGKRHLIVGSRKEESKSTGVEKFSSHIALWVDERGTILEEWESK